MARHEYTPGQDGACSAEIYRLQIEQMRRDEERKKALAELNEYKKPVEKAVHTAEKMLERQVRRAVTSDPIANEIRNANIYGGFVTSIAGGIALSVAAVAAEAANNRALERARDELTSQQHNDYDNAYQERQTEQTKSLAEYKNDVAERSQLLEASSTAYYNEYKSVKDDATATIAHENEAHEKRMREYDKQEREADNLAKADRTRADEAYQNRLSEIEKLPASERHEATREAERTRDAAYRDIDDKHNRQLSAINNDRDSSLELRDRLVEHENNRINEAKQNYSNEIKSQKNSLSNAEVTLADFESARDERIDRREAIKESRSLDGYNSKYDSARHFTDDELKLMDRVKADDDARKLARKTGAEYTPMVSDEERRQARELQREHKYNNADRASAYEFTKAVNDTHTSVGHSLAATLGTDREKALLQRVADDNAERKAAEKAGKPYTPQVTNAERAEAKAIEKQYAGSISSKKDINDSIDRLGKASAALGTEITKATGVVSTHEKKLEKINTSIASKQAQLGEINAATKALRSGKDENGSPLSADKRAQLESKLKSSPSATQLQKDINGLMQNRNATKGALEKANGNLKNLQQTKNATDNHIGMLQRNKGAIADTAFDIKKQTTFTGAIKGMAADKRNQIKGAASKKINNALINKGNSLRDNRTGILALGGATAAHIGRKNLERMDKKIDKKHKSKAAEKLQGKAGKMMKSSMKNIQREANKAIHKGNAIHKELFDTARKLSRVAQKYELALSIGAISLKVMKMPAAFAAKCGRHTFRHIGGHTRLGKQLADARRKRMLKIDGWKDNHKRLMTAAHLGKLAGKGAFKTVLHAPTKLLNAPRAVIGTLTDPTILAKKAAQGAFRLTRKTTGFALKKANQAARFGGKMGRKAFNKTLGRTKLFKKMSAGRAGLLNKLKMSRLGRMFGGARKRLLNLGALLKKAKMKIAAWLASAFSSILSALFTVLGYAMLAAIIAFFAYMLIMIVSTLLTGVINAITNWLNSLTADERMYVKNNPEYIMDMAVQYRNAELELLDVIRSAQSDSSRMGVSADPIYYAITNETGTKKTIKKLFGTTSNPKAQSFLDVIKNSHNKTETNDSGKVIKELKYKGDTTINTTFDPTSAEYNSIQLAYYASEYLEKDASGRVKATLKPNAVASKYELSNAKDAMAIVDSLYAMRTDTMQKVEVLAYLGVGETQISKQDNPEQRADSLFWNTHKIIYRSGTKSGDVWYHVTEKKNDDKYIVNASKKYSGSNIVAATDTTCDNKIPKSLQYHVKEYVYTKRHQLGQTTNIGDSYEANRAEYYANPAISNHSAGLKHKYLDVQTLYFQSNGSTSFKIKDNTGTKVSLQGYKVKTNSTTGLNYLHKNSACDTLYFYRVNGQNGFAIVDKNGYYVGYTDITKYSSLYYLMHDITVNPSDDDWGNMTIGNSNVISDSGYVFIDYFWIKWDGSKYTFDIISDLPTSSFAKNTTTESDLRNSFGHWYGDAKLVSNVTMKKWITLSKMTMPNGCIHEDQSTTVDEDRYVTYEVCGGHLDLDIAIGVICGCEDSQGNENNDMFIEAMYVDGIEKEYTDYGFLGIYSANTEAEVNGWGATHYLSFHPDEDWKAGSELRDAARLKTRNTLTYGVKDLSLEDTEDRKIRDITHISGLKADKSYDVSTFKSIKKLPNDMLGFGFKFNGKVFYQDTMISGEQKGINCYQMSGDSLSKKKIDIAISNSGTPVIKYH